jgi:hypothetical protein
LSVLRTYFQSADTLPLAIKSGKVSGDSVRNAYVNTQVERYLTVGVGEPSECEETGRESEDHLDTEREAAGSSLKCLAHLL